VNEYRSELKKQIDNAISTGKLQRFVPQDRAQPIQYQSKRSEFSSLPPLVPGATPWKLASSKQLGASNIIESEDTTKMLFSINQNILETNENIHRMNEKLDRINEKANQKGLDVELHYETLQKLLPSLLSIVKDLLGPLMTYNIAGLGSQQSNLQKHFTNIESTLLHLNNGYKCRNKRSSSPPPLLSPSQQPETTSNNALIKETLQIMNQ
jgi:hypothetical protein